MRRLPTMLASASAAALTTLAVTVAVPAIADNAGSPQPPDGLAACLRAHGLAGAPDGEGLKQWLGPRLGRGGATTEQAIAVCAPKATIVERAGPSEQELRSCLTEHGVAVPGGDGMALKRWLLAHGDDAENREAMKACHFAPPGKPGDDGPCGKERGGVTAVQRSPADKPATAEAGASSGAN